MELVRNLLGSRALVTILIGLAVASCSTSRPIYNVASTPITVPSGQPSAAQVRAAIVEAATNRGWIVKDDVPGRIQLELLVRNHMATVNVDYSQSSYSITYQDSENLNYDGSEIHRNYNRWIMNLQREINQKLSAI